MEGQATVEWLSIKQAAKRVGFAYKKVYNAVRDGSLVAYQPGGQDTAWRIKLEDLDAWVMGERTDG